jgi:hypothetical protein
MVEDSTLRAALWDGGLYVIRDVFNDNKFVRCEYATTINDGELLWQPCIEGVLYADIEPVGIER